MRWNLAASDDSLSKFLKLHLQSGRLGTLNSRFLLLGGTVAQVWPLEQAHDGLGLHQRTRHPVHQARDRRHQSGCRRQALRRFNTFCRALDAILSPQA